MAYEEELLRIAQEDLTHSNWKKVSLHLGFSWNEITALQYDSQEGGDILRFEMLMKWCQKNGIEDSKEVNRKVQEAIHATNDMSSKNAQHVMTSDLDMYHLAEHIGPDWKSVGIGLSVPWTQLRALEYDGRRDSVKDVCMEMLQTWKQSCSKEGQEKLDKVMDQVFAVHRYDYFDIFFYFINSDKRIMELIKKQIIIRYEEQKQAKSKGEAEPGLQSDSQVKPWSEADPRVFMYECPLDDVDQPLDVMIVSAINKSNKIIVITSNESMASGQYTAVFSKAWEVERKRGHEVMIPVLIHVKSDQLPSQVVASRALEFKDETSFHNLLWNALQADVKISPTLPAGDVATGLACNYYFGYLKLKMPTFDQQLEKALETAKDKTDFTTFRKFVILIPKSCSFPVNTPLKDFKGIEHVADVPFSATRAGIADRSYNSTLLSIQRSAPDGKINDSPKLLASVEFATPLLSLYEMKQFQTFIEFTQEDLVRQTQRFIVKLNEIFKTDSECRNQVLLLYYEDLLEHQDPNSPALADTIYDWIVNERDRDCV